MTEAAVAARPQRDGRNIETTFNTYYELQDHLYKDHDMKKDPAMDIFNKYKTTNIRDSATVSKP